MNKNEWECAKGSLIPLMIRQIPSEHGEKGSFRVIKASGK